MYRGETRGSCPPTHRQVMVFTPFLVYTACEASIPMNHYEAGHWCMLVVSPEGHLIFDPAGGSEEHLGLVNKAVKEWVPEVPDGGVSTIALQGDRSNCAIWLMGATAWLLGGTTNNEPLTLDSPPWSPCVDWGNHPHGVT